MRKNLPVLNCISSTQGFQGFGFGDGGLQMSFGIGAFPFGIFATAFNINDMYVPITIFLIVLGLFLQVFFFSCVSCLEKFL